MKKAHPKTRPDEPTPPTPPRPPRPHTLMFRASTPEKKLIADAANAAGLDVAVWMRTRLLAEAREDKLKAADEARITRNRSRWG